MDDTSTPTIPTLPKPKGKAVTIMDTPFSVRQGRIEYDLGEFPKDKAETTEMLVDLLRALPRSFVTALALYPITLQNLAKEIVIPNRRVPFQKKTLDNKSTPE